MPRQPTSQREKKLKGNSTKRKETKDLIAVDSDEPDQPPWLDKIAKKEWARLVPILNKVGALSKLDGVALGMLCQSYSIIETCFEKISNEGPTFLSPNGHVCQRPEVKLLETTSKQYLKLCEHFGMTPKSRSSMKIVKTGKTNAGGPKTTEEQRFEDYFGQERSALVSR